MVNSQSKRNKQIHTKFIGIAPVIFNSPKSAQIVQTSLERTIAFRLCQGAVLVTCIMMVATFIECCGIEYVKVNIETVRATAVYISFWVWS